jgi:hypothetical protein
MGLQSHWEFLKLLENIELLTYSHSHKELLSKKDQNNKHLVRFEVSTAVTMKVGVFWDLSPSVLTRVTRRNIPEDAILNKHFFRT